MLERFHRYPFCALNLFVETFRSNEELDRICRIKNLLYLELLAKRVGYQMTATRIIEQFSTLRAIYTVFNDGSYIRQLVPLSKFQQQFISALQAIQRTVLDNLSDPPLSPFTVGSEQRVAHHTDLGAYITIA